MGVLVYMLDFKTEVCEGQRRKPMCEDKTKVSWLNWSRDKELK